MRSIKTHFTRETDNLGTRVTIPDSEDWIQILGPSSDKFRLAQGNMRRALIEFVQEHGEDSRKSPEFTSLIDEQTQKLRISQIGAWSFEEPLTDENVRLLFKEAPHIEDLVDKNSGKRKKLETPLPSSSEPTPSSSSS